MSGVENPAAFPTAVSWTDKSHTSGGSYHVHPINTVGGMSLRDWFAGQALAGLCANRGYINAVSWETAPNSILVSRAYALADAMLAARKGTQS